MSATYNKRRWPEVTYDHVSQLLARSPVSPTLNFETLVRGFQKRAGLVVDGQLGPKTCAALLTASPRDWGPITNAEELRVSDGWLVGAKHVPIDQSWYRSWNPMNPLAVIWHYSVTSPNTAENMFVRRQAPKPAIIEGTSWHVAIEPDGRVFQGIPFTYGAWHASTHKDWYDNFPKLAERGKPNHCTIGIELISKDGSFFPEAQVKAAAAVLRAIVREYGIPRKWSGIRHSDTHPRRSDPGPVWEGFHRRRVQDAAHAPRQVPL